MHSRHSCTPQIPSVGPLWHVSAVCNLQDAVADLFAQYELGVRCYAHQHFVELQLAAARQTYHAPCTQQVYEELKHGSIEELGRVQSIHHGHPLRRKLTTLFERHLRDLPAASLHQYCDRQVVALDRL